MAEPARSPIAARTITCLGMDWRAEVSLRETLSLLRGRTRESWVYADELNADVIVYDVDHALAQALLRREQADGSTRIFIPSHSRDPDVTALRPPFGASRLIRCLDEASARLAGQRPPPPPSSSLCQQLDELLSQPGLRMIALQAGRHRGLIEVDTRRLRWPLALSLDEMAEWLLGRVEVSALTAEDAGRVDPLIAEAAVVTPAEGLLWALGVARSNGQLLRRLDVEQPYQLRHWPDFGLIGRRSLDLRCTTLLMQRPMTPVELARLAGTPLSVIGGYLNAALLCGALEAAAPSRAGAVPPPSARATAAAAPAEGRLGDMLRRLRMALS